MLGGLNRRLCQVVQDLESPLILAYEVFAQATDAGTLMPLRQRVRDLTGAWLERLLADAAYASALDLFDCAEAGLDLYAPYQENDRTERRPERDDHRQVLQVVQPALAGMMDGSVSTLAPLFATALATRDSHTAFLVGVAAAVGAGISMAFAEALSDDGSVTGRGNAWVRGLVEGVKY